MPTYDYLCKTCGLTFENFQSITSEALQHCPMTVCPLEEGRKGTGEVERLISAGASLVFKGEGFYQTDYVRKKSGSGGGATPGPAPGPSSEGSPSSGSPPPADSKSSSSDSAAKSD